MQVFSRRGFQLRKAPLETRLAYTGFLVLMVPGAASLVALSVGPMGFSPSGKPPENWLPIDHGFRTLSFSGSENQALRRFVRNAEPDASPKC